MNEELVQSAFDEQNKTIEILKEKLEKYTKNIQSQAKEIADLLKENEYLNAQMTPKEVWAIAEEVVSNPRLEAILQTDVKGIFQMYTPEQVKEILEARPIEEGSIVTRKLPTTNSEILVTEVDADGTWFEGFFTDSFISISEPTKDYKVVGKIDLKDILKFIEANRK